VTLQGEKPRGIRVVGSGTILRRLLGRPDGFIGLAILGVFVVLAIIPQVIVGPLQTAVTATGGRLTPRRGSSSSAPTSSAGTC